ncbi:MAG TPA: MMPL family transporter [Thermoanaerobaculia bacterium]|nr:MMPL family transporter [Thermoanaerobaculia bacterium]
MIDRTLDALAKLCLRHSKQIAIVAAVMAVLSFAAASRLTFDPDLLNLIPQKNKQVNDFRKVLRDMGTIDYHIIVMEMPAGRDVHEYDSLIEQVAQGYKNDPRVEDVSYKLPNPLDFVDVILPRALLFLTPAELSEVADKLSDAGIRESVTKNKAMLQTPQAMALKQLVQYDPFGLAPVFLRKFQSAGGGFKVDVASGYYLSSDHTTLILLIKPKKPAQDVPFAKQLLIDGQVIEGQALADFQKNAGANVPLPRISHTGGYTIAVSDADLIRQDIIINVVGSFFGVLGLFIYAFRRIASVGYAALPMALGLAMTFGLAGLVYGTLSSASAGFAALLAGLGIDFITVFYGRYVDERNRGESMPHAMVVTIRSTVPAIFIAAVTTAATFFAFLATDFRGMTQLGFLTGTGILFFLLCVVFLLPALIILGERRERRRAPKLYLHSFGSGKLIDAALRRPRLTIAIWAVFIVVTGLIGTRVRFSDNIQDLRAKGNEGVINQAKLTGKFGQSFDFMMYVIQGKTLDEVMARTYDAAHDLDPLVRNGSISSYQSISTFLPPKPQQQAVIEELRRGQADRFNPRRITTTFRQALIANDFRAEVYDQYMRLFSEALTPEEPVSLANIGNNELLKLTARFVKQADGGWMSVIYLYPNGGRWPREVPPALFEVADKHPQDILTGVNLVSGTLRRIVRADAMRSTLIGFLAVALLMFISFRGLKMTLLTFVPFLAGVSGMLGLMAVFDLEFNFMNIFVGLMVIGVATDYAVYMLERYKEDPLRYRRAAHETGKAVVMAALTAIVGYGSFALSHYPGLRSIGYASTFGIGLSGLAAITLLPAILVLGESKDARDEGVDDSAAVD